MTAVKPRQRSFAGTAKSKQHSAVATAEGMEMRHCWGSPNHYWRGAEKMIMGAANCAGLSYQQAYFAVIAMFVAVDAAAMVLLSCTQPIIF